MESRNILLRNYQIKLFEEAKNKNTIIYLPAGSGKTIIAIHVLLSKTRDILRPFSEGGKRAFFLAHTKVMTFQLAKVLGTHTKFKVAFFNGDMNVDSWSKRKWTTHFEQNQVIVLTGEILRQLLVLNFIKPPQIALLVLDECHHAVADHPYNLILQNIFKSFEKPIVLGLTSVLLNSNPGINGVSKTIRSLESSFEGKVITETELEEIMALVMRTFMNFKEKKTILALRHLKGLAANPIEKVIVYKNEDHFLYSTILELYDNVIAVLGKMLINSLENSTVPSRGILFKNTNKAKRIRNGFVQAKLHFEELGIFGGSISALYFIILFEKYRLMSNDEKEIQVLVYGRTEMNKIRHILLKIMGNEENSTTIFQYSSHKVQQLIRLITGSVKETKNTATLVFVHQRATAVVLSFLLKRLSVVDEELSFDTDFVVGCKESTFLINKNEEIIRQFASRSLNVLIATNVLEEGIDISICNTVISFDFPLTYSSYFQSKGRARNRESIYYIFMEEKEVTKKKNILENYKKLGEEVMEVICENSENCEKEEENESKENLEKIRIIGKTKTISVDGLTAIRVVYRYCSKLPQDSFSFLSPTTWYIVNKTNNKKKAFLQLPTNCPLHDVVEGEWKENKKLAKKSSFLAAVKKLYELGELDDDLNVISFEAIAENFSDLFPNYKVENTDKSLAQPGTKKRKQIYKMKFSESLSSCLVSPGVKAYLHVFDLTVAFDEPEIQRKIAIYDILRLPITFAVISSKKLFKIFQFPLFIDIGEIKCDFLVNYDEIILTESEINDIKMCHFALFQKVTQVLKDSQVFDNRNKEHSFFVAPVEKNEEGRFVLSWDIIRSDFCKNNNSALVLYHPPSPGQKRHVSLFKSESSMDIDETLDSLIPVKLMRGSSQDSDNMNAIFVFNEAMYKYFVITPKHRYSIPPQYYIVSKICHDMTPKTPFPREEYIDYLHYYKSKYSIDITNTKQPLFKVCTLYHCSNFNKPRSRKAHRARDKYKEFDEHFVPELCDVIPFDRRYWIKALLLPTVLNRIYHVYCVEEFRRKIVVETGLGLYELPEGTDWKPLEVERKSEIEYEEESDGTSFLISSEKASLPLSKLKDNTQKNVKDILDLERNLYGVGLCDLEFNVRNIQEMEKEEQEFQEILSLANNEIIQLAILRNTPIPTLSILKKKRDPLGPSLSLLTQACTSTSANDIVNYERLEMLGDSFLKFAVTLFLFKNYPKNEGILSALKGKIVGNRNLLYCGLKKGIQDCINVTDFAPLSDWNPPLLRVPERIVDSIISNNTDPAVLYRLCISFEEQLSGVLSETTFKTNEEIIKNYDTCWEISPNSLLPFNIIQDKTISDAVEAFIGAYLVTLGLSGAFEFLLWMEILPKPKGSYSELMEKSYENILLDPKNDIVMNILNQVFYWDLEDILDYCFKDKALLLEALTHPSYVRNRITNCYQRLELLGDSIIDFLITTHIYENCGRLTPGQISDIRSSLVNNITFACLVVRYEVYKYMLSFSSDLTKAVENFVSFQNRRNHVVDENVLILLEENDCLIGESILVPKALGDLFESLAGAIFLDSGNSLETVWKIYYRLMKREIDEFTKNTPKTATRLLQEICSSHPSYEAKQVDGMTKVSCTVYYNNQEITGHGFGPNKKEGKRSAAKLVLNKILSLKN